MYQLIKYGNECFILFLFPLIGLFFEGKFSRRNVFWIIGISSLLLIPIFTPYTYVIPYVYRTLILMISSAFFTMFLKELGKRRLKVACAVIASAILFVVLGFFAFMDSFSGYQRVERYWRTGKYKIEYIRDQGFAGGPLLKYELSKYAFIPLFVRQIDTAVDNDAEETCTIYFSESKLSFNKCDGIVTRAIKKD